MQIKGKIIANLDCKRELQIAAAITNLDAGRVLAGFGGADAPALSDGLLGIDVDWV